MNKVWSFRALDTLFFRDGTPFHLGEQGIARPGVQFPPMMFPLQGAIRTCLARRQGWVPGQDLPRELGNVDSLGQLQLEGPYLRYKGQRLDPIPHLLLGKKDPSDSWSFTRIVPGPPVESDLGTVRLPRTSRKDGRPFYAWVTREGLQAVLNNQPLQREQFYLSEQLWKEESKVGIKRNNLTRQVEDKHLYSLTHIRPVEGLEIVVKVSGIPEDWHPTEEVGLSLGGEGRFAQVRVADQTKDDELPKPPEFKKVGDRPLRYTVSLLTPGWFVDSNNDKKTDGKNLQAIEGCIKNGPPDLPGICVSASIGKMDSVGGWDLKNRRPRPLTPVLPAGSTWFFEASWDQKAEVEQLHGSFCGLKTEYGMGQIVIGIWDEHE